MRILGPISIGTNAKIGCPGFSKAPVKDCGPNCSVCATDCYALKAYRQYPQTRAAWDRNGEAMREAPYQTSAIIHKMLSAKRKRPTHFRIHVSGDFLDQVELNAWSWLAESNPDIIFYGYTKAFDLDFSECPGNMRIRWSHWEGLDMPMGPKFFVRWGDERDHVIPPHAVHCTGACGDCGYKCADLNIPAIWIDKH